MSTVGTNISWYKLFWFGVHPWIIFSSHVAQSSLSGLTKKSNIKVFAGKFALYFLIKLSTFILPCSPTGPPIAHIKAKTNNLSAISQYFVFSAPLSSSSSSSSSFLASLFSSFTFFNSPWVCPMLSILFAVWFPFFSITFSSSDFK